MLYPLLKSKRDNFSSLGFLNDILKTLNANIFNERNLTLTTYFMIVFSVLIISRDKRSKNMIKSYQSIRKYRTIVRL